MPGKSFDVVRPATYTFRSEEHTSELQSLTNLVCRLLLDTATTEIYTLSLHDALPIFDGDGVRLFDGASAQVRRRQDRRQPGIELGDERFEAHVRVIGGQETDAGEIVRRRPARDVYVQIGRAHV